MLMQRNLDTVSWWVDPERVFVRAAGQLNGAVKNKSS